VDDVVLASDVVVVGDVDVVVDDVDDEVVGVVLSGSRVVIACLGSASEGH